MANRIQLKRSSLIGKRPEGLYLEPGELALNTNADDPGLFFEANDGTIVKVGPVGITSDGKPPAVSGEELPTYGRGELWLDRSSGINVLKVYADGEWLQVGA
jgi:hypothetical protein